ncbi:inorganic triphosphatase YgiF [Azomonas agilis]|uniref:Inorganic triphosphatase YgiF n=2 Tax=Azomonas agilis TaxID=116849 RepID=A0A562IKB9_9GAMM|nr:inorganic triphosphatase YgiF [Azomonas agilis]
MPVNRMDLSIKCHFIVTNNGLSWHMQKETEIKLRVSRDTLEALRQHPILTQRLQQDWLTHPLYNQYYDTPNLDLAKAQVALRLRRDGEQFIQTLKSRGQSVAGLSERNEWDWYLQQPTLDPKLLTDDCWPASLAELDRQSLQPIFTTDFVRTKADLSWSVAETEIRVEAALDLGQVISGERHEEICELELELRQGESLALLDLALELAQQLPVMPCDISKAERGYRLQEARTSRLLVPPVLEASASVDDSIALLGSHLLGNSQRLAEEYDNSRRWSALVSWVECLVDLRALLGSLGLVAPRTSTHNLRAQLDALLADWQPRRVQGQQHEHERQAAEAAFNAELTQTRWGVFSLQMARWLISRQWTQPRTERGQRQGNTELGRWLARELAEESAALRLPQYERQPLSLAEQLPRMERLLVWLRFGRSVLELPEIDRLYGELAKLHDMLLYSLGDKDLMSAQIHTLWTLKPWKVLAR